jgi:acetyl-CoA carboxylase biotin carboxyl carrier protein
MPSKNPSRGGEGAERSARAWSLEDIQELLDVLAGREITEFEMEQNGVKIRIKRGNPGTANSGAAEGYFVASPAPRVAPSASPPLGSPAANAAPPAADEVGAETAEGLYIQKSPIVGTFYSAPAPNAPSFVKPGDVVQVGQVLCIIEAMKLMNELEAEVAGEIVRVYVENGQPVEYGQSLFAIKPSHKK